MKFINYFLDSINYYIYQICKIFDKNRYRILKNIKDYSVEDLNPYTEDIYYYSKINTKKNDIESL